MHTMLQQRRFDVIATSHCVTLWRRRDVVMTLCVYWIVTIQQLSLLKQLHEKRSLSDTKAQMTVKAHSLIKAIVVRIQVQWIQWNTVYPLYILTFDTTTQFVKITIWMSRNLCSRGESSWKLCKNIALKRQATYVLAIWGDSNKYPNIWGNKTKTRSFLHVFLSVMDSLRILYKSKFSLMATSLATNAVVVTRDRYM